MYHRPFLETVKLIDVYIQEWLHVNRIENARPKDMMPYLVEKGVFAKDYRMGLPLRKVLRKLDSMNCLHLIRGVHVVRRKANRQWFFRRIKFKDKGCSIERYDWKWFEKGNGSIFLRKVNISHTDLMMSYMDVTNKLNELYSDIKECHMCRRMDSEKTLRLTQAVNPKSDVFIISQALAASQLRRSGVNFFQRNGKLGSTGKNLEKFLNRFNRSVYPYRKIKLSNGVVIPKCKSGYLSVYNTEIVQCYPGKKEKGHSDRTPGSDEILNCIKQRFLIKEIKLIKPKLLLLMGKKSRDAFYKFFMNKPHPHSLSDHISRTVRSRNIPTTTLNKNTVYVLPIQHASGANPSFNDIINNKKLIQLIKDVLK